MNTNNENELKPGDRVRLTGWTTFARNPNRKAFSEYGHSVPCSGVITIEQGRNCVIPETQHVSDMGGWNLMFFTYEKIETDGNG